ncbi:MAG: ATP-binding protein [Bacillota bacterium]
MVGRERELDLLQGCMAAAAGGMGGLVLISGEAGVGKSALVSRFLEEAGPVLYGVGHCPGHEETPPFGPWLEALGGLGAEGAEPVPLGLERTGKGAARELAGQLQGWLRQRGPSSLLLLEDMHWSDTASLELLLHLTPLLAATRTLVLATYRLDELQRQHPLWLMLPELRRRGARQISLERLDLAGVLALVRAALPEQEEQAEQVARHLHARTGGHPLFVSELLASHIRAGDYEPEDPLPETVLQAIDIKLHRLSAEAFGALSQAALIGERFRYSLLAQVSDLSEDALADALEEAAALRLIHVESQEPDRFHFSHALVREALLARLLVPRRRRWHLRIAEALMQAPAPDPNAIGMHLHHGGDPRAADWLRRAGDAAHRLGAAKEARELYQQALAGLQGASSLRAELLLKIGNTQYFPTPAEGRAYWQEVLMSAEEAGDQPVQAWARHMLALQVRRQVDPHYLQAMEAVEAEQAALAGDERFVQLERELYGSICGYPRIAGERAVALAMLGRHAEALQLAHALRAAGRPGSHMADLSWAELYPALAEGQYAEMERAYLQVRNERLQLREYSLAASTQFNRFFTALIYRAGEPDELDTLARETEEYEALALERAGQGSMRGEAGFSPLGVLQFLRGDWEAARRNLLGYFRQAPYDQRHQRRWFAAELAMAQGDWQEVRTLLSGMHPRSPAEEMGPHINQVATHALWAAYHLEQGEPERARAWLEGADRWTAGARMELYRPLAAFAWVRLHLHEGELTLAAVRLQEGLEVVERLGQTLYALEGHRLAARVAAAAGEKEAVKPHLERALSLAERCRFPCEAALAQLLMGRLLPPSSEHREQLIAARDRFAALGAARPLREAEAALEAYSALPARRVDSVLTEREQEVVRLVAQGHTDREIGARLFISRRTVDRHLRNIFTKLEINSRSALGAYAARNGLLD